jgi:serine protease Do
MKANESESNKFVAYLLIIAAPFALGAFLLAWSPSQQFSSENPASDGYVPPRSINNLVDQTQASTVTVWCETKAGKGTQGTASAIDFGADKSKKYRTTLITNHHVIERCIGTDSKVSIALPFEDAVPAEILKLDKKNDLATLGSKLKLPPLKLSENSPWPGYWVMALGSADGYEGSISFGNVINTNKTEILITNNISRGSSGGPLIDNEGFVVGVTSWGNEFEQYNGAKSLDAFCSKIFKCPYDKGNTWWDYTDD